MMAITGIPTETAPAVRWEPCGAFHPDDGRDGGTCAACGWPADDHGLATAA